MANLTGQKFGGRAKGTPNKTTSEIREFYQLLLDENLEQIKKDISTLEPRERLKIILEISKFVVPTLKATELNNVTNDKFTPVIFEFNE